MSRKFLHVGCVTHDKDFPGLNYNKVLDCYCSDPTANEHNIEWLFFPETSPLAKTAIATTTHIAYMVDDLEAAVAAYCHDLSVGSAELGAERRGHRVAHRAHAAACEETAFTDHTVGAGPELVLSDVTEAVVKCRPQQDL